MSGYFDKLIQSYKPEPEFPGQMPWITEDEAAREQPIPVTDSNAEAPPRNLVFSVEKAESVDFDGHEPNFAPQVDDAVRSDQAPSELQRIERVTDRIIERLPEVTPQEKQAAEPAAAAPSERIVEFQELHETHFHVENTHSEPGHAAIPTIDETGADATFVPDDDHGQDAPPEHELTPRDAELAELEAHLAKALSQIDGARQPAPATIIEAADFEPDDSTDTPLVETETIREITREIVKEIHHHHETQTEPAPRTAPKSADEASQIGWIRFASAWDQSGGSW